MWQIRHKSGQLVTVSAAQYSVDPPLALIKAQATFSHRVRHDACGLISLDVGRELSTLGVKLPAHG